MAKYFDRQLFPVTLYLEFFDARLHGPLCSQRVAMVILTSSSSCAVYLLSLWSSCLALSSSAFWRERDGKQLEINHQDRRPYTYSQDLITTTTRELMLSHSNIGDLCLYRKTGLL